MKPELEMLPMQAQFELAKKKTADITARAAKTRKELTDKLARMGFSQAVCEAAAQWAQEYYFINDADYARRYIERASKKYGTRRIVQALLYKGIDRATVEDALADFEDTALQPQMDEEVKRRLNGQFDRKSIDRVIRHFLGRGFSYDDVRSAIDRAKRDFAVEEDDFGL